MVKLTNELKQQIIDLLNDSKSTGSIMKELNCSRSMVQRVRNDNKMNDIEIDIHKSNIEEIKEDHEINQLFDEINEKPTERPTEPIQQRPTERPIQQQPTERPKIDIFDNIESKNEGKNAKYNKLAAELKEIKSKLDSYKKGATEIRGGILKTYYDDMALDKEQLNSHFDNSYQFLNDITSDIGLDNRSLKTGLSVLETKKKKYDHNKNILDDLDNYIDTHIRQKNLQIDYLFKGDDISIFIKLVTICLLLVLFVYILSYYKVLDDRQASYTSYAIFILFGGIALIKMFNTLTNKDKSMDNKPLKNKSTVKNP